MTNSNGVITRNFSAGPGVLPTPVLKRAQAELVHYGQTGMSVMEMSHRSPEFEQILRRAEENLRTLMAIPDTHHVLFLQGGASLQFSQVLYNLVPDMAATDGPVVDYIVTGVWSEKAHQEATKLLPAGRVNLVLSTKSTAHNGHLPTDPGQWRWSQRPAFLYYCDNETVHGVEWDKMPTERGAAPYSAATVPIVCDMSSNILSRKVDVSKYGIIFGGAQKNIGPAGVTVVIVRDDLLALHRRRGHTHHIPPMLDYLVAAENKSMYNTPPTFGIYMAGLVFEWLLSGGGLDWMERLNVEKSTAVYNLIEQSDGFYTLPVVDASLRSRMNIPIRIRRAGELCPELETKFLVEAEDAHLVQLAGHRSVGGLRVSLYNAMGMDGVRELLAFMRAFQAANA